MSEATQKHPGFALRHVWSIEKHPLGSSGVNHVILYSPIWGIGVVEKVGVEDRPGGYWDALFTAVANQTDDARDAIALSLMQMPTAMQLHVTSGIMEAPEEAKAVPSLVTRGIRWVEEEHCFEVWDGVFISRHVYTWADGTPLQSLTQGKTAHPDRDRNTGDSVQTAFGQALRVWHRGSSVDPELTLPLEDVLKRLIGYGPVVHYATP